MARAAQTARPIASGIAIALPLAWKTKPTSAGIVAPPTQAAAMPGDVERRMDGSAATSHTIANGKIGASASPARVQATIAAGGMAAAEMHTALVTSDATIIRVGRIRRPSGAATRRPTVSAAQNSAGARLAEA